MSSDIKNQIFFELEQMAQYIFEPKTKMTEIQRKLENTVNILVKILDEIQKLYKIIESDEIIIGEEDLPDIIGRFNDLIDQVIQAYNNWIQMSQSLEEDVRNLYSLNMDMQEIRVEISTLLNNIVGGYSI